MQTLTATPPLSKVETMLDVVPVIKKNRKKKTEKKGVDKKSNNNFSVSVHTTIHDNTIIVDNTDNIKYSTDGISKGEAKPKKKRERKGKTKDSSLENTKNNENVNQNEKQKSKNNDKNTNSKLKKNNKTESNKNEAGKSKDIDSKKDSKNKGKAKSTSEKSEKITTTEGKTKGGRKRKKNKSGEDDDKNDKKKSGKKDDSNNNNNNSDGDKNNSKKRRKSNSNDKKKTTSENDKKPEIKTNEIKSKNEIEQVIDHNDGESRCPLCKLIYQDDTPFMLQCEGCPAWVHAKCCNLTFAQYHALDGEGGENEQFFCLDCCTRVKIRKRKVTSLLKFVGANPRDFFSGKGYKKVLSTTSDSSDAESSKENKNGKRTAEKMEANEEDKEPRIVKPPEAYFLFRNMIQGKYPYMPKEQLRKFAIEEWLSLGKGETRKYLNEAKKKLEKYKEDFHYQQQKIMYQQQQQQYDSPVENDRKRRRLSVKS